MCDVNKYYAMYQEMKNLAPNDTFQLIANANSKEEQDFFAMVGDFFLQHKQKELIEKKAYQLDVVQEEKHGDVIYYNTPSRKIITVLLLKYSEMNMPTHRTSISFSPEFSGLFFSPDVFLWTDFQRIG